MRRRETFQYRWWRPSPAILVFVGCGVELAALLVIALLVLFHA
jgi:hypothetical protein